MSERREGFLAFAAAARVGGPALVLAFFVGLYLHNAGRISVAGWTGIMALGGALGFALGLLVWYGTGRVSDRLVKTLTASGNLPGLPEFSLQDSLVIRGRPEEARQAYEAHLRQHPDDLNAKLALARLWRDQLGRPDRAEQLYLEARQGRPSPAQEFAIGNALIDLYRASGQPGRELAELARFAERFAGTAAGEAARRALARLKHGEP